MQVVLVAPHDSVFDKVVSNVQEVKARGGRVIVLTSREEPWVAGKMSYTNRRHATVARGEDTLAHPHPRDERHAEPRARGDPAAAPGVLHRGEARVERGSAEE